MRHAAKVFAALFFLATPLLAEVTKEDIRKLAAAGISENIILSFIRVNGPVVRMSSDDLVELKAAGATDRVLEALVPGGLATVPPPVQEPPAQESTAPPAALPDTTYVDYASTNELPGSTYYSAVPMDYYAPGYSYYYSPWFGACSPYWDCGWGFGFPCYSSCFYPWYRGCFASFGFGCSNFGVCFRPFGFCGRPFGSFCPRGSFGFGVRRGAFPSFFAASTSVGATIRRTAAIRSTNMTRSAEFVERGSTVRSAPATSAFEPRMTAAVQARAAQAEAPAPRVTARSYPSQAPSARGYYAPTPRYYSSGNTWRPAPSSHGFGGSGFSGHGGGWGGGGGHGGGGGGGGGHGGGGHGGHGR